MIELFHCLLRLRRYKQKSVEFGVFGRGGSLWLQILDERGRCPPTVVGAWYQNIRIALFGFVTKHACVCQTDRLADRQNYDSEDRASIAASRCNKT